MERRKKTMYVALILLNLFLIAALTALLVAIYKVTREDYDIIKYHSMRPTEEEFNEQCRLLSISIEDNEIIRDINGTND